LAETAIKGLHHITLVTGNYKVNNRFYTAVMGLRQVKLSVNQDDIYHRHAFYANPEKTTGSTITFFEWPHLPNGSPGLGSPHHLAYRVKTVEQLVRWKRWLEEHGVKTAGPQTYGGQASIYLRDPDNALLELTAPAEDIDQAYLCELLEDTETPAVIDADMRLTAFDHATLIATDPWITQKFLEKFLAITDVKLTSGPGGKAFLETMHGGEVYLRYSINPLADTGAVGKGSIHHIALAVETEQKQREIMRRLNAAHIPNSGIVNRYWFKSLYFRDLDGNLLEIATVGPGYEVDEPRESLGSKLILPPWLEPLRNIIEGRLARQDAENPAKWPPEYSLPDQTEP
jgi:glyoxalase family protein